MLRLAIVLWLTLVLVVELRGQRIGSETPRSLRAVSEHLDSLLPGIRLLERLSDIPDLDHQKIVNILAEGGPYAHRHQPPNLTRSFFQVTSVVGSLISFDLPKSSSWIWHLPCLISRA